MVGGKACRLKSKLVPKMPRLIGEQNQGGRRREFSKNFARRSSFQNPVGRTGSISGFPKSHRMGRIRPENSRCDPRSCRCRRGPPRRDKERLYGRCVLHVSERRIKRPCGANSSRERVPKSLRSPRRVRCMGRSRLSAGREIQGGLRQITFDAMRTGRAKCPARPLEHSETDRLTASGASGPFES